MLTKEASSPIFGDAVARCRRNVCVDVVVRGEYSAVPSPANAAAHIEHATEASLDLVAMVMMITRCKMVGVGEQGGGGGGVR